MDELVEIWAQVFKPAFFGYLKTGNIPHVRKHFETVLAYFDAPIIIFISPSLSLKIIFPLKLSS